MRRVSVTPANVHDSNGLEDVLPWRPGEVFADAAYQGLRVATTIRKAKGRVRIVRVLHGRSRQEVNDVKAAWNAAIRPVRCRVEKVFGTIKRSYGLARARYLGLERVSLQVHLTMLAYNLKRVVSLERKRIA